MYPKETVEKFIETILEDKCKFEDIKKFLTVTQQDECLYVGSGVEGNLNGIYMLLRSSESIEVKELINTAKFIKDAVITMKRGDTTIKRQCRLVKEIAVSKAHEDGTWGINASSFKVIK